MRSDGTQRLLLVAAVAVAGYTFWPQIQNALPDLTRTLANYAGPMMRLDPTEQSSRIEDRRGERGGDLGRLGPPPQWGRPPGGGMPPWWGEARGEAFPGPETSGAGGPHYDPQGRPYRRWRDCTGSQRHPRCGPWQYGPAPATAD